MPTIVLGNGDSQLGFGSGPARILSLEALMDPAVQKKLFEINRKFYEKFAPSFSSTRARIQPGVKRLIRQIDYQSVILDIGCGNGTFARALAKSGFEGQYLGIDMSADLLKFAAQGMNVPKLGEFQFLVLDLAEPDWWRNIPGGPFDWVTSFAVLHHLPGKEFRQQTVRGFGENLKPSGWVAVSVWQWQNSPRLQKRVQPWETVGLQPSDVDQGDVLLDWRAGEEPGLRYVHTFTEKSLTTLAWQGGFRVLESFYSDGETGDLALYQIWQLRT